MPSLKEIAGRHPVARISVSSSIFRGIPSGLDVSKWNPPV
jgi:hypothetical protein